MTGAVTWEFVRGIAIIVLSILVLGTFIVLTVKKADDPAAMAVRWLVTIVVMGFVFWKGLPLAGRGGIDALIGLAYVMCGCLVMLFIWRRSIASLVAEPFGSLYDGGSAPPDPHPAYSVAMSRQKQGRYLEAVAEIRKQLDRFPTDVEGHMMLAQIQAENLKDLPAAETTIDQFCSQSDHAAKNVVFALYSLADWHLAVGQDAEAARRDLEKIVQMFPGSEFALGASQRIAHLANPQMRLDGQQKQFIVREGIRNLGLVRDQPKFAPTESEPGHAAAEYVKHLEQHPFDTEAREKLALIYASHYSRLDLAADQLEQMISQPAAPAKSVARWLNLLADLQIQAGADYETVKQTLQRIIDRDPSIAAADIARNRINRLKLEMKSVTSRQAVKIGTYEQNIGLKR